MRQALYDEICHKMSTRESLKDIALAYPEVSYNTLLSIYGQKYQEMIRNTYGRHKTRAHEYFAQYREGVAADRDCDDAVLVRIAETINLAPCLLARQVVTLFFQSHEDGRDVKNRVNRAMRDPAALLEWAQERDEKDARTTEDEDDAGKVRQAEMSWSDQAARLNWEIAECVRADDNYSPLVTKVRASLGLEYEFVLYEKLRVNEIPFITEDEMRLKGYPKTPDVKLEVPIVLPHNRGIVNWIESKATFGDAYSHRQYLPQYYAYHNRFGPGLVIYWFGFIDELATSAEREFFLLDSDFPSLTAATSSATE